jgi:hypothetical protein
MRSLNTKLRTMTYITMTEEENERLIVINSLLEGEINGTQASLKLGFSVRHTRRLKSRVKEGGAAGIVHKLRGKESNNKLNSDKVKDAVSLIKKHYADFAPTLANEKLSENHDIKISVEALRQIMIHHDIWKVKPRKKNKQHKKWRPRKEMCGVMQQYDGSYHHWLEDRAEEMCLLLSVDDATGKITHAKFDYHEGIFPTFNFWKEYIEKNGKPQSIYLDKFSTYKVNHKNAKDNSEMITQFQRASKELGIRLITAHSPEGKGRVERMFQTLQDRLVKEMRLASICTIDEANAFLQTYIPKFNTQFAVVAHTDGDAHRTLGNDTKPDLHTILAKHDERVVMNDYTVRFENKYFQLKQEQPTTVYKKDKVTIIQRTDGSIGIQLKDVFLHYDVLPKRPVKVINIALPAIAKQTTTYKPPPNHPWRTQILRDKILAQRKKEKMKVGHF